MAWIVLAALLFLVIAGVWLYNGLVRLRNQVRTAWSDIDVQLLRRHDLVPMLVDTVKAFSAHERTLLQNATDLRARALETRSPTQLAGIETQLEQSLSRMFALQEDYPELKASENFSQLQRDLVEIEKHLQYARRFYNGAVRDFNDGIQQLPGALIARAAGFGNAEFFTANETARIAPAVEVVQ